MFGLRNFARTVLYAAVVAASSLPALAQDASTAAEATYAEIEGVLGGVPGFIKMYPKQGVAGFWALQRDLIFGPSALDSKTKALISLAVAAQIPCTYCIYSDTQDALRAGARRRTRSTKPSPSPA